MTTPSTTPRPRIPHLPADAIVLKHEVYLQPLFDAFNTPKASAAQLGFPSRQDAHIYETLGIDVQFPDTKRFVELFPGAIAQAVDAKDHIGIQGLTRIRSKVTSTYNQRRVVQIAKPGEARHFTSIGARQEEEMEGTPNEILAMLKEGREEFKTVSQSKELLSVEDVPPKTRRRLKNLVLAGKGDVEVKVVVRTRGVMGIA